MPTTYLFSRRNWRELADVAPASLAATVFFQMWRVRADPYNRIEEGDAVYIGDPSTRRISWEVRVSYLLRTRYRSKREALAALREAYGLYADDLNDYHRDQGRADDGHLLAWAPVVIRKLDVAIPDRIRFGQNGYRELPHSELEELELPRPGRRPRAVPPAWYSVPDPGDAWVFAEPGRRYIPMHVREAVAARDGNRCVGCGAKDRLHLDHIEPFSLGGRSTVENLRLVCAPSNLRRGVRPVHEPLWCVRGTQDG